MKESSYFRFLSVEDMKHKFGWGHGSIYQMNADKTKLPSDLEVFISFINYFYVKDQVERELIMEKAPLDSLKLLEEVVKLYETQLNNYLGGPESYIQETTDEYRALTELREMSENYHFYR